MIILDSTISHVGFILLALTINSIESIQAFIFYLMQYSFSNLNFFFLLISLGYFLYYYNCHYQYNLPDTINSPAMRSGKPLLWVLWRLLINIANNISKWVLWPNSGKLLKLLVPSCDQKFVSGPTNHWCTVTSHKMIEREMENRGSKSIILKFKSNMYCNSFRFITTKVLIKSDEDLAGKKLKVLLWFLF